MAAGSGIEWTEATWNPVTGCTKVSSGCLNCYAERMSLRLQAMGQPNYRDGFAVRTHEHMLGLPLTWKQPRSVFVNSMSDLFHDDVPEEFIRRVFAIMKRAHWHTFQVLTKRSRRLCAARSRAGVAATTCGWASASRTPSRCAAYASYERPSVRL